MEDQPLHNDPSRLLRYRDLIYASDLLIYSNHRKEVSKLLER
jgi:hypothetical protein